MEPRIIEDVELSVNGIDITLPSGNVENHPYSRESYARFLKKAFFYHSQKKDFHTKLMKKIIDQLQAFNKNPSRIEKKAGIKK